MSVNLNAPVSAKRFTSHHTLDDANNQVIPRVMNVAAITAVDVSSLEDGQIIVARGRSADGDGGGGTFRYTTATTATVDNGIVFAPATGTGRILRDGYTSTGFVGDVNLLWFGYTAGADVYSSLQAAINVAGVGGSVTVVIPPGTYTKLDTSATITCPSGASIEIKGYGDRSLIYFDDRDTNARSDLFSFSGAGSVILRNFKIKGTASVYKNQTNQSQCLTGSNIASVTMEGVTIEDVRYMATAFSYIGQVNVSKCKLYRIVRDGFRFVNSWNVKIAENEIDKVSDDCIALHSLDAAAILGGSHIISDNVINDSQGIKVLGARSLLIHHNVMQRMIRSPIYIETSNATEGGSNQASISITDNIIQDSFGTLGTNYIVYVGTTLGRAKGGLSQYPGVSVAPYSYNYANDIDNAGIVVGTAWLRISGNTIGRTLPAVAAFSSYGFGGRFDRQTVNFDSDPAVADTDFGAHAIMVKGPAQGVAITHNMVFGGGTGFSGIRILVLGTTNVLDFIDTSIGWNKIIDCPGTGVNIADVGSGSGAKQIKIHDNEFNLDPYFRHSTHASDNTWTGTGGVIGLNIVNASGIIVGGNVFKNCGRTGVESLTTAIIDRANIVHADFSAGGPGDNAANKGVRNIPAAASNLILPIIGDPTLSTYGQIENQVLQASSTIPTTGRYLLGHVVRNTTPNVAGSAGSRYSVFGWWRLTTGTAHVSGTDWSEMRSLTGT